MNPFPYTKNPTTRFEALSNSNYWWYEGMECPPDTIEAHWRTFIREMKRSAARDLQNLLTSEDSSSIINA